MKIKQSIIKSIDRITDGKIFEIGGILGMSEQNIVTHIAFDIPEKSSHPCKYYPNVNYLNGKIIEWNNQDIDFCGMFHTHFADVDTLSFGDKEYIKTILLNVPDEIEKLYFPIYTLPSKNLKVYSAALVGGDLVINDEKLEIV